MELDPIEIMEILKEKGITHLYHANTVQTASSFIKAGGLFSRGAMEDAEYLQTPQSSDELDKQFNVWYDIFLDSSDLHSLFNRQNHYGPVLFKFDVEILSQEGLPPLWVTTTNPIYWDENSKEEERYFQSTQEVNEGYTDTSYRQMITLRNTSSPLLFEPYLEEIILDNPGVRIGDVILKKKASEALAEVIAENDYILKNVKKRMRKCSNCWCKENYLRQRTASELKLAFYP
ncbi:hypothetical protein ACFWMP_15065 [Paenibacillus sp. NPDC058367]|uniref:hypothetical protein n=1 Tax=Paenibacillus sp. NPDC058367 TaxID=3346460 RepID=UPI00365930AD